MSLRRITLLLFVIAAPPVAVGILWVIAFAAIVVIYSKTGIGIDLEFVATASIALLALGYGGVAWLVSGRWLSDGQQVAVAKRAALAAAAMLLGAASG